MSSVSPSLCARVCSGQDGAEGGESLRGSLHDLTGDGWSVTDPSQALPKVSTTARYRHTHTQPTFPLSLLPYHPPSSPSSPSLPPSHPSFFPSLSLLIDYLTNAPGWPNTAKDFLVRCDTSKVPSSERESGDGLVQETKTDPKSAIGEL